MTGPRLKAIIICSDVDEGPPIILRDLRRQWRTPPDAFWVVADIENPTEQSFAWQIQLAQRRTVLDSSVEVLEVRSPRQLYLPYRVGIADAKPVIYSVRWLLNGKVAGTIDLDFGFPEAAQ